MKFNEDSRVKIPSILHLMRLGYKYLSLKDSNVTRDESTNIFTDIFHQSIKRINPLLSDTEVKQQFNDVSLCLENEDLGKAFYEKMLAGVVSMPSNIFANTGTNVSILFIDKENTEDVVLIDASNLGETVKEGKNQKTVLTHTEEDQIISTFNHKEVLDDFSVVVSYEDIKAKNYSLSAGQYFEVKIEYVDITQEEFTNKINKFDSTLTQLFSESHQLELDIQNNLKGLKYE